MNFSRLLQPKLNPFRLFIYSQKEGSIILKTFPPNKISSYKLSNLKSEPTYCNSYQGLFISQGNDFWIIDNSSFQIRYKRMPREKRNHSMIFIPCNFQEGKIFIIGGEDKKTFYYDLKKNYFINWAETNELHNNPALVKVGDYLYIFDSVKNNKLIFERTKLTDNNKKWEIITPNYDQNILSNFPSQTFAASIDSNGRIIFLGGNNINMEQNNTYVYDIKENKIYLSEKGTNDNMNFNDKTFYLIDNQYSVALPEGLDEFREIAIVDKKEQSLIKTYIKEREDDNINIIKEQENYKQKNLYEFFGNKENKKYDKDYIYGNNNFPKEFGYCLSAHSSEEAKQKAKNNNIKIIETKQKIETIPKKEIVIEKTSEEKKEEINIEQNYVEQKIEEENNIEQNIEQNPEENIEQNIEQNEEQINEQNYEENIAPIEIPVVEDDTTLKKVENQEQEDIKENQEEEHFEKVQEIKKEQEPIQEESMKEQEPIQQQEEEQIKQTENEPLEQKEEPIESKEENKEVHIEEINTDLNPDKEIINYSHEQKEVIDSQEEQNIEQEEHNEEQIEQQEIEGEEKREDIEEHEQEEHVHEEENEEEGNYEEQIGENEHLNEEEQEQIENEGDNIEEQENNNIKEEENIEALKESQNEQPEQENINYEGEEQYEEQEQEHLEEQPEQEHLEEQPEQEHLEEQPEQENVEEEEININQENNNEEHIQQEEPNKIQEIPNEDIDIDKLDKRLDEIIERKIREETLPVNEYIQIESDPNKITVKKDIDIVEEDAKVHIQMQNQLEFNDAHIQTESQKENQNIEEINKKENEENNLIESNQEQESNEVINSQEKENAENEEGLYEEQYEENEENYYQGEEEQYNEAEEMNFEEENGEENEYIEEQVEERDTFQKTLTQNIGEDVMQIPEQPVSVYFEEENFCDYIP